MKKTRLMSMLCAIAMALTISVSAANVSSTVQTKFFNEYDYIETLQQSTPQELQEIGLSVQKANAIISEFKSSLSDRASLPTSDLRAYGYNDSEIALLRSYANGQTLSNAALRALGSTCTAIITRHSCTTKTAEFSYTWTWDRCPIMTLSDSSAMRWIVYDVNGGEIGVEQVSSSMLIEYHFQGNAASDGSPALAHYGFGSNEANLDFNTINMQFPVYQTHRSPNGMVLDCYAKTGTVKVSVKVPNGVNQTIHHIFVGGLYGHTLVGIGSPSVSVSSGSIAISFTGNTSTDPIALRKATIYQASTPVSYW